MIKLLEDNTVICSDGANVNSGHPDKTKCAKGRKLAESFTYRYDIMYARESERVEELAFDNNVIGIFSHQCDAEDDPKGGAKLVDRHSHKRTMLGPLDSRESYSDRVRAFASIVFS